MSVIVDLYSEKKYEIYNFLKCFYDDKFNLDIDSSTLKWEEKFKNPIDIAEIIGVFIDNADKYNINMWVSLDKNTFVNVSKSNANDIIKYLYERFPY